MIKATSNINAPIVFKAEATPIGRSNGGSPGMDKTEEGGGKEKTDGKGTASRETSRMSEAEKSNELSAQEKAQIEKLKSVAASVRAHEMAHVAAGAQYVTKGASFQYKKGPDGINYAVAGEVSIDTSPVPGDPQATIAKMEVVRRAALAPADPSPQDIKVAAQATQKISNARMELILMKSGELNRMRQEGDAAASGETRQGSQNPYMTETSEGTRRNGIDLTI